MPTLNALVAVAAASLLLAPTALAGDVHAHAHVSIEGDEGTAPEGCGSLGVRFDRRQAVRDEETFQVPGGREPLQLSTPEAGGMRIEGWDGPDYTITACKVAPDRAALAALRVERSGRKLVARGGGGDEGVVFLLVKAPRNAVLELDAENGPLSVKNLEGDVRVRLENGPLSLRNVSGKVDADAVNGPISLRDGSGDYRVSCVNGPLSVRLSGSRWEGGELVAETRNGPLDLRIPEGYGSAVRIETSSWVPVSCRAKGCPDTRQDRSEGGARTIELGTGKPSIRLSTTNGPVTVKEAR